MKKNKAHIQPIVEVNGITRFKPNAIVEFLFDRFDSNMNALACMEFTVEDREQFAQLIGYSLSGFEELSYVQNSTVKRVRHKAGKMQKKADQEAGE